VFPHGQDVTGWHVYSADWRTDRIVFAVDGIETYRVTRPMVEQYGRWAYEAPKFLILNVAIGGNYPRMVNRAVEPYPGLPEATVHLIQSNDAVMLVDWVKVTD
jgi:beta-glucanase (GH16 family)